MATEFKSSLSLTAASIPLRHSWEHAVGSGRALLALRADWREQLMRAHRELGFRHVRFHGVLDDDMGTLICHNEPPLYSFFERGFMTREKAVKRTLTPSSCRI